MDPLKPVYLLVRVGRVRPHVRDLCLQVSRPHETTIARLKQRIGHLVDINDHQLDLFYGDDRPLLDLDQSVFSAVQLIGLPLVIDLGLNSNYKSGQRPLRPAPPPPPPSTGHNQLDLNTTSDDCRDDHTYEDSEFNGSEVVDHKWTPDSPLPPSSIETVVNTDDDDDSWSDYTYDSHLEPNGHQSLPTVPDVDNEVDTDLNENLMPQSVDDCDQPLQEQHQPVVISSPVVDPLVTQRAVNTRPDFNYRQYIKSLGAKPVPSIDTMDIMDQFMASLKCGVTHTPTNVNNSIETTGEPLDVLPVITNDDNSDDNDSNDESNDDISVVYETTDLMANKSDCIETSHDNEDSEESIDDDQYEYEDYTDFLLYTIADLPLVNTYGQPLDHNYTLQMLVLADRVRLAQHQSRRVRQKLLAAGLEPFELTDNEVNDWDMSDIVKQRFTDQWLRDGPDDWVVTRNVQLYGYLKLMDELEYNIQQLS